MHAQGQNATTPKTSPCQLPPAADMSLQALVRVVPATDQVQRRRNTLAVRPSRRARTGDKDTCGSRNWHCGRCHKSRTHRSRPIRAHRAIAGPPWAADQDEPTFRTSAVPEMRQGKPPSGGSLRSDHALSGTRHDRGRITMEDRLSRLCPDLGLLQRLPRPVYAERTAVRAAHDPFGPV